MRCLQRAGASNLLLRSRTELDLTDQAPVKRSSRPKTGVCISGGSQGSGIKANDTYPAEFLRDNLAIQTNVIHSAWQAGRKLCFLGSSCIYPKLAPQPMPEEALLTGPLEPTNEWYAIAKIAGIKMCQAYRRQYGFDAISVMPTNPVRPGDNFDLENSHVLPAMIRRFHEAKLAAAPSVTIWGTGTPRRSFCTLMTWREACVFLMQHYSDACM